MKSDPQPARSFTLRLRKYQTGWDKGWHFEDGDCVIEAHAPSAIVFTVDRPGDLRVRPEVRSGGKTTAIPHANGHPVKLGEWLKLSVAAGSEVKLEAAIEGNRDQCWNRWRIADAEIGLPEKVQISFWKDAHLGDSLGMMMACENFGRANGAILNVRSTPLFKDIAAVFKFEWVVLEEGGQPASTEKWVHVHPFGYQFEELGWVGGILLAVQKSLGGRIPEAIRFPGLRIAPPPAEAITLVQLDGRSGGQWQAATLRQFLRLYEGRRIAIIGGPDTPPYLGVDFEYRTGNLSFLTGQLLACERFVGTDSGMAHLACMLGLEVEILPSPAVSLRLVHGVFGHYPKAPVYRTIHDCRDEAHCDRRLFLVSTTNGWNLGDDLIRQGVMRLLKIDETDTSIVWLNRCQVQTPDEERKCSWSPLWKCLRNLGDRRSLAENARAFIVAGTPEWIDTMQPFFRLAVTTALPIWIVGVGGGQEGQIHHLKDAVKERVLRKATVRDEKARRALAGAGLSPVRFFDPAFHADEFEPVGEGEFLFNPRLETREQFTLYLELYKKLKGRIDRVVVHEPMEHARACNLFGPKVYYHSDYRRYVDVYRRCSTYVGGRMHGAIPSLASGAEVHLICHEGKHNEMAWTKEHLDQPEALTLWAPADALKIDPVHKRIRYDQSKCRAKDFAEHQAYWKDEIHCRNRVTGSQVLDVPENS